MRKISLCLLLMIVFVFSGCIKDFPKPIDEISSYAQENDRLTFSRFFTDFEWDECYNDINYYGEGREISERTGYDIELPMVGDHIHRFAFFNDGVYVKYVSYEYQIFHFPDEVFVFYPDTAFLVEWKEVLTNVGMMEHLYLVPEDYDDVGLRES